MQPSRNVVERVEDPHAALVQVLVHSRSARALRIVLLASVLAGQEARGEREVRDDADVVPQAHVAQRAFERVAVVQVVQRLQRFVARQSFARAGVERLRKARCREVRRADRLHLALLDQPRVGVERFLERRRLVVPMRLVQIDRIDLQPAQRFVDGLQDVVAAQAFALPHVGADLRGDDDVVVMAAARDPASDDRLRFAALSARVPSANTNWPYRSGCRPRRRRRRAR